MDKMGTMTTAELDLLDSELKLKRVSNAEPEHVDFLLKGIQKMTNIYAGTVDPVTIAERRAKNKVAKRSRRINRKR